MLDELVERPVRTGPDGTSPVGVAIRVAFHIWNRGNLDGEAGQVVLGMMFNKETTATGRIHVCSAHVAPCEDPECQMVVSAGWRSSQGWPLLHSA